MPRAAPPKRPSVMEVSSSSLGSRERGTGASSSAGDRSSGGAAAIAACHRRAASGPTAWLRRVLRGAQAVAEERSSANAGRGEDADYDEEEEAEAASEDGAYDADVAASLGSLPEHLLERVFSHLRGANRRHHFATCGVNRQWRRLGRQMFFSRPWEVAHLICHPTQLFCLSPRNVTGSRSGLLKCFVRREAGGPGGKRFTFHIGKDSSQPQRSRFLLAAKQGGRGEMLLFLNSRCQGAPCARLCSNTFATQYKLSLAEELQLEPTSTSGTTGSSTEAAAGPGSGLGAGAGPSSGRREFHRLSSWGEEAAAEAVAAAAAQRRQHQQRLAAQQQGSGVAGAGQQGQLQGLQDLGLDCFAELQYQARVRGFMQPRRMRVVLPHPSLLFYDQQLPQLSRRASETIPAALLPTQSLSASAPGSASGSAAGRRSLAGAGAASASSSVGCSLEASPAAVTGVGAASTEPAAAAAAEAQAPQPSGSGRLGRLLLRLGRRRQALPKLLRQPKTVPAGDGLQPVILQNKAPHWNEGLRCWCLNFRGRVKLASVKNFQLVRADDGAERVVMQFGKAEQDAFILDFNPTVLTAVQAFSIVLSTFDSKFML